MQRIHRCVSCIGKVENIANECNRVFFFFQILELETQIKAQPSSGACVQCKVWERKVDHLVKEVTKLAKVPEENKKLREEIDLLTRELAGARKELDYRRRFLTEKLNVLNTEMENFSTFTQQVKKEVVELKRP